MQPKIIRNLKRDKLISKCEKLLVKGTDSITDISEELGISYNTARGYVELVKSRWVDSKSVEELQSEREGLIKKVQEVIKESWQIKNTAKTALEASQALRTVLMAVEQLRKLQGLDMLPLALDETDETKIFNMAQEVNKLPKKEYKIAMHMIEAEIIKKGGTDENDFTN
ncbi:MAG: hypothetical protein NTZ07_03060 [Candidatus Woesebacteria bacterium]|nr:hypothetical protein [Candidatus Woesebacteria bacterium]